MQPLSERGLALRRWLLCLAVPAWAWARSTFTPWAPSREPRLWLYDALYYLGFALMAWAIAELALGVFQRRRERTATLLPLTVVAGLALLIVWWTHSESGLRVQLKASANDLRRVGHAGHGDMRQRAGAFLVDTVRAPCIAAEPWLWLGQPHGAGTGINRALVFSGGAVPYTPQPDAYAFWPVADGWWMAYQHARRDLSAADTPDRCMRGRALDSHRQGMAWIAHGRR